MTLIGEPRVGPLLHCNIGHVRGRDRDFVIDSGLGVASLRSFARDNLDRPVTAVATHTHLDHIGNTHEFDECLVHPLEADGLRCVRREFTLAGPEFEPDYVRTLAIPQIPDYEIGARC